MIHELLDIQWFVSYDKEFKKFYMNILKEALQIDQSETFLHYFSRPKVIKSLLVGVFMFATLYGLALYGGLEIKEVTTANQNLISSFLMHYPSISWLLYILLLIVAVMSPLPDSIVILAGGFLFGPIIGTLLTIVGQSIGASIDFILARKLGRAFVVKKFPKSAALVDSYSHKLGWQTIFLMRLLPTLSFDMLSYAAGLSSLSFKKYILATMSGLIPLAIITTLLGHSANIHSSFLAAISLLVGAIVIVVISYFGRHFIKTR